MAAQYHIICNKKQYPINTKVITWLDDPSYRLPPECYKKIAIERKPKLFVNHWDACLSSAHCVNILIKRELSVHFALDYNGTIYQLMDTNDVAWHAKPCNSNSIGVEINNPVFLEYQTVSEKFFKERPIMSGAKVHGSVVPDFLWFHPEQIEALKILWKTISEIYNIPLVCPLDENGLTLTTTYDKVNEFNGFVSHYHITKVKTDCAGLDLKSLLENCK